MMTRFPVVTVINLQAGSLSEPTGDSFAASQWSFVAHFNPPDGWETHDIYLRRMP